MTQRYCANCGASVRSRFCEDCGAAVSGPAAPPAPSPERRGWSGLEKIIATTIGVVAVGALLYATGNMSVPLLDGSRTPVADDQASPNLPPVGVIWFGQSFDIDSFEIRGRTDTVTTTESFALVGTLSRVVEGAEMNLRVTFDGQQVSNQATGAEGSGDVWGFTYGPLFAPGTWTLELTDIGGNVLASGDIVAIE